MRINDFLSAFTGGDLPEDAVREQRCLRPPIGCGEPLTYREFPTRDEARRYEAEWRITGLCASCQDLVEAGEGDE
ncbi:hypothetical protein [Streptomyces lasiicapitis]|uniref:hypothetical protein n=1 Tax=Streptomyces lasiicapitis TaxID=1923961 RepID=UPI0036B75CAA